MRSGWTKNTLGNVVLPIESVDPTRTPVKNFRYVDVSSVSNESFEIVETSELVGKDAPSRARRKIRTGDVIFATIRPTLKRVAIVPPDLDGEVCSTGYFVFRTKPFLDSRYLFYWLLTDKFFKAMERLQTGASYPAVNDTQVRQQEIVYPPVPEQQRIVAILDEAFAGLATVAVNAERNLKNARELFESRLHVLFANLETSSHKALAEVSEIKPPKVEAKHKLEDSALVSFVPMEHLGIDRKFIEPQSERRLGEVAGSYTYFADGDVLLAKITPCFENGKLGIARNLTNGVGFGSSEYFVFRPKGELNSEYLYYFLSRNSFRAEGEKRMSGAVGHKRVAKEFIENLRIPMLPLIEQERLVIALDSLREQTLKLGTIYKSKIKDLTETKRSLLQKAFSGELTSPPSQTIKEAAE